MRGGINIHIYGIAGSSKCVDEVASVIVYGECVRIGQWNLMAERIIAVKFAYFPHTLVGWITFDYRGGAWHPFCDVPEAT